LIDGPTSPDCKGGDNPRINTGSVVAWPLPTEIPFAKNAVEVCTENLQVHAELASETSPPAAIISIQHAGCVTLVSLAAPSA